MKHYFRVAKDVDDLTRILCSALENQQAKDTPGLKRGISRFTQRVRKIPGSVEFVQDRGRITLADPEVFKRDPVSMIRLCPFLAINGLAVHATPLTPVTRPLSLFEKVTG